MTNMTSESLHRHMPEPVSRGSLARALVASGIGLKALFRWAIRDENLTFAHVLNVHTSEEVWPGEAVDLFLLPFFAKLPHTGMFVHQGMVHEHMRCETLRLCSGKYSAIDYMEEELSLRLQFGGPFPLFEDSYDDEGELSKPSWLEEDFEPFYYPEDISSTLPGEGYPTAGSPPTEKED